MNIVKHGSQGTSALRSNLLLSVIVFVVAKRVWLPYFIQFTQIYLLFRCVLESLAKSELWKFLPNPTSECTWVTNRVWAQLVRTHILYCVNAILFLSIPTVFKYNYKSRLIILIFICKINSCGNWIPLKFHSRIIRCKTELYNKIIFGLITVNVLVATESCNYLIKSIIK